MTQENRQHEGRAYGGPLPPPVSRLVQRLSSRYLLFALGSLFVLDLFVPDVVPFVDEIVLGLATILLARWQGRTRQAAQNPGASATKPPPKNVTPED